MLLWDGWGWIRVRTVEDRRWIVRYQVHNAFRVRSAPAGAQTVVTFPTWPWNRPTPAIILPTRLPTGMPDVRQPEVRACLRP